MTYATREELDRRADELSRDLRDTERLLRDRDDEKERILRAEFVQAVNASEQRTHDRFDAIDAHLASQDTYIMRRRFTWAHWRRDVLSLLTASLLASLILHFGLGL